MWCLSTNPAQRRYTIQMWIAAGLCILLALISVRSFRLWHPGGMLPAGRQRPSLGAVPRVRRVQSPAAPADRYSPAIAPPVTDRPVMSRG